MAAGGMNKPNSPRQRMINLMYLVFIAMTALNVSSEVLNGFEIVERSLRASIENSSKRNGIVMHEMQTYHQSNPEKTKIWYEKANLLRQRSDSLFNHIQQLKIEITRKADGKNGDPLDIKHKEDLDAASQIMLNPISKKGKILREAIDSYRDFLGELMIDTAKLTLLQTPLKTEIPKGTGKVVAQSWESLMFDNMPTSAAITILTKLQSDIRYAEGEVLSNLLSNVDIGDFRVNLIQAQVIPESKIVMKGGTYNAHIVLSSVDSTAKPHIVVNGKDLSEDVNGRYSVAASQTGKFPIKGFIEMPKGDGSILRREFESEYFVTEPIASVAPVLMNVLYAGIDNPLNIAASGVASQNIQATITNGEISRKGDLWIARPKKVGTECIVSVNVKDASGRMSEMSKTSFRVRSLPDPQPFIEYKDKDGNMKRFKGGKISKRLLLASNGIKAALDDDLLNVPFQVISFELVFYDQMGNATPEISRSSAFSDRQKANIRNLSKGQRFYISNVHAKGPDGIERRISPIEVIVN